MQISSFSPLRSTVFYRLECCIYLSTAIVELFLGQWQRVSDISDKQSLATELAVRFASMLFKCSHCTIEEVTNLRIFTRTWTFKGDCDYPTIARRSGHEFTISILFALLGKISVLPQMNCRDASEICFLLGRGSGSRGSAKWAGRCSTNKHCRASAEKGPLRWKRCRIFF